MKQDLSKKLKLVVSKDRINDKDRLTAAKNAQKLMSGMKAFCAGPGGILFGLNAEM